MKVSLFFFNVKTLSLALALTLVCLNPKIPNPNLTLIESMNLIKARQSSKIWSVSVRVMNINELVLTRPQHYP